MGLHTGNVQSRGLQRQEEDSWVLGTEEGEMVVHGMGDMGAWESHDVSTKKNSRMETKPGVE